MALDPARAAAFPLAVLCVALLPRALKPSRARLVVLAAALAAAALSALYVVYYLRGGPRIIDATAYYLEGRLLSQGRFTLPLEPPVHAIWGRFLLADWRQAGVIFPPGYPAVLALGFLAGAPLAVGPVLGAALVVATSWLAREVAERHATLRLHGDQLAAIAAVVSALSAALRYHTADTMAHGLAALCLTVALAAALGARRRPWLGWVAGLATGWLFATRPASALALGFALLLLAVHERPAPGDVARLALGVVPGVALWFAYQHAVTGSFTDIAQSLYYQRTDGPAGCFRYGFGAGVGCLGEHAELVRRNLPDGYYGAWQALATTARRLKLHLADPLSWTPLYALVPLGAFGLRRERALWALPAVVVAQVLAYAPFYFDGNYPGGGARLYADVLPVEQVLAAVALVLHGKQPAPTARLGGILAALMLGGFGMESGADHALLRDREGGQPMYRPELLEQAVAGRQGHPGRPGRPLVFIDTDHGFNLALGDARVARYRGDAGDWLAWRLAGSPDAYRYRYLWAGEGAGLTWIEPYRPRDDGLLEAEGMWPAIRLHNGWVWPVHLPHGCVSAGRALGFVPEGKGGHVYLAAPGAIAAGRTARVTLVLAPGERATVELTAARSGAPEAARAPVAASHLLVGADPPCRSTPPLALPANTRVLYVKVQSDQPAAIDALHFSARRR